MFKKIISTKCAYVLFFIVPIVLLDQITKQLIHNKLYYQQSIKIINGFFNLTYVRNFGAAWGMLSDLSPTIRVPFFWTINIIAIIGISIWIYHTPTNDKLKLTTLALILSGALGNFLDRIGFFHSGGYVIDFLDVYLIIKGTPYHWPAFNIADSAISVSIVLLILVMIKEEKERKKTK